jgi:glutamate synthase (ferredoxin)
MTGGVAWVYDADGSFVSGQRYHLEFLVAEGFGAVDSDARNALHDLVEMHVERSASELARTMLADWPRSAEKFVRLSPKPQV